MWKAKLITILICSLLILTGTRERINETVAQQTATDQQPATKKPSEANQTVPDLDQVPTEDVETPPVKKNFTPAKSLNEALYLSTREDRDTTAYLDQAKNMLDQKADATTADTLKRTPLHWAVIGAMYADKKQASSYVDLA